MFHQVPSIVLLTLCLAFVVQALNISNNTLEPTRKGLNISVEPPLTDFINATELDLMQRLVPQEEIEWINATLNSPWTSNNMIQEGNRRTRNLHRKLLRRYVDVTRCPDLRRRVVMRNELHAIMQMILDAIRNMTLSHPVWRALISPAFREEPRALERMKGLLQVLYDTINDTRYTVVLSCNAAKPQCLKTRKAPGSGKQQVPAAYYNIDENVVNLCDAFFGMPQVEDLECKAETPMSYYSGMCKRLLFTSKFLCTGLHQTTRANLQTSFGSAT